MKHLLITLALILATNCMASTNYIAIAIRTDTTTADKVAVRDKLKVYFSDVTDIKLSDLPIWRQKNDHTKEWYVVCLAVDVGTVKKLGLKKSDIDTWKENHLANPNLTQVMACGMSPSADIESAGLEPIPSEIP